MTARRCTGQAAGLPATVAVVVVRGWGGVAMVRAMAIPMASVVKALAEAAMAWGAEAMGMAAEMRAAALQLERQREAKAKALAEAAMASGAEVMGMAAEVRAAALQLERQRAAKATRA